MAVGSGRAAGPWRRDDSPDRVYAVGDVHGRLDLLLALERQIEGDLLAAPARSSLVCYLGDYIDRGPDSRGVVRHLAADRPGRLRAFLMGNHEARMLDFLADPERHGPGWAKFGGVEALASWGVDAPPAGGPWAPARDRLLEALEPGELGFLRSLEPALEWRGHLLVHAGVDPAKPLVAQGPAELFWIREPFLSAESDLGLFVVHGHVPGDGPVVRANRVGVDTGAWQTGRLTCAVLGDGPLRFLEVRG